MKKTRIRLSLFSLVLALVLFGLTIRLTGRDPLVVYWSILTGSFGSTKSFLNVLAYMLPLIMTGLGAAVAFQSGVFNIGGEGQVLVGGLASVIVGLTVPLPAPWGWLLALLAGFAAGALWALLPTLFAGRNLTSLSVATIMMNSIAIYFCAFLSNGPWKTSQPNRVSGTDPLDNVYRFTQLIRGSNLTTAIFASAIIAFFIWYVMSRTATGFEMKLTGHNPRFAKYLGLSVDKLVIGSMVVSGAICGLVGMMEAYGVRGNYQDGISNEYYFDGLLVAMIMGYRPVGIIVMSFFFAFLKVGAAGMELNAGRIVPHHPVGGHFLHGRRGRRESAAEGPQSRKGGGKAWVTSLRRVCSGRCSAPLRRWPWRPWAVC